MFESSFSMAVTQWGEKGCGTLEDTYFKCWAGIQKYFDPNNK